MMFEIIEQALLYFILTVAFVVELFALALFVYTLWVALTQGTRLGRKLLGYKDESATN